MGQLKQSVTHYLRSDVKLDGIQFARTIKVSLVSEGRL